MRKKIQFLASTVALATLGWAAVLAVLAIEQANPYFTESVESFGLTKDCGIAPQDSVATTSLAVLRQQCVIYNVYQVAPENVTYPAWITGLSTQFVCAETWSQVLCAGLGRTRYVAWGVGVVAQVVALGCYVSAFLRKRGRRAFEIGLFAVSLANLVYDVVLVALALPFSPSMLIALGSIVGVSYTLSFPGMAERIWCCASRRSRSFVRLSIPSDS